MTNTFKVKHDLDVAGIVNASDIELDTFLSSPQVEKTVGVAGDFTTLDDALDWYMTLKEASALSVGDSIRRVRGRVRLTVGPGVHTLKARSIGPNKSEAFAIAGVDLVILGTSCTGVNKTEITLADDWDEATWDSIFLVESGTHFSITDCQVDATLGGLDQSVYLTKTLITVFPGGECWIRDIYIKNFFSGMDNAGRSLMSATSFFNCDYPLQCSAPGNVTMWDYIGADGTTGDVFYVWNDGYIRLSSDPACSYTNNFSFSNVPVNTVTPNGTIFDAVVSNFLFPGTVPETRTINGLPLSADITIDAQGGFASSYLFCEDVMFGGTSPVWHELESQSDGGTTGSHTVTTGSNTYVEMDRYVTNALNTAIIPGGNWSFVLYAKTDSYLREKILRAIIYRVDSAGAIVGGALGTATSAEFINEGIVGISLHVYIAAQTGWDLTDRLGVVVQGNRVDGQGTLTFYHDASSGWASSMESPLTLLHNQMNGLNQGDFQHLTAAEKTKATTVSTTTSIGLAPALSNNPKKYLNGTGLWDIPDTLFRSTAVSITAASNDYIEVTANNKTIMLPPNPNFGDPVIISVGNFTNTTIERHGNLIQAIDENIIVDTAYTTTALRWVGGSIGWKVLYSYSLSRTTTTFDLLFARYYNEDLALGGDATFTRAGTAYVIDNVGAYWLAAANWPRFQGARIADPNANGTLVYYSTTSGGAAIDPTTMYLLIEKERTNYLLNSASPATQTTASLSGGTYCLSVVGSGSALASAGTAVISGAASATAASPDIFEVINSGTVVITVTGTLTKFQLEKNNAPTSFIATTSAIVTRAADVLTYSNVTDSPELVFDWLGKANEDAPVVYNETFTVSTEGKLVSIEGYVPGQRPISVGRQFVYDVESTLKQFNLEVI